MKIQIYLIIKPIEHADCKHNGERAIIPIFSYNIILEFSILHSDCAIENENHLETGIQIQVKT